MEVIDASMKTLHWKKTRVPESLLIQMDKAVSQLSQARDERYRRITHLFGKMYIATIDDMVIFTAGTQTRPARITAIALDQKAGGKMFVLDNIDDIRACCDRLGIEDQSERREFSDFVTPKSKI